mgnify:CR=1 FL=1
MAFVFVTDAVGACGAFLGLLRGCAFAWFVFGVRHFAQIGRFDFGLLLWYNYIKKGGETVKEAENILTAGGDAEMMSDSTLHKMIEYLKSVKGWTDAEIVELLKHITK